MLPLEGKRALVCGSSAGIGKACAIELAGLGAAVTLTARRAEALERAVAELPTPSKQKHAYVAADFDDHEAMIGRVQKAVDTEGPFEILVNNSGGPPSGPLLDAEPDAFVTAITRHVVCNHLLVQTLLPGMKSANYGRIINIISTSVLLPIKGLGVSNTTRGAVANWARTLAGEVGSFGITVNNVLPGFTATERLTSLLQKRADKLGVDLATVEQQSMASIPAGRFAGPGEIAAVVGFLASSAASYVNGVNLPVDGGRTAVQS